MSTRSKQLVALLGCVCLLVLALRALPSGPIVHKEETTSTPPSTDVVFNATSTMPFGLRGPRGELSVSYATNDCVSKVADGGGADSFSQLDCVDEKDALITVHQISADSVLTAAGDIVAAAVKNNRALEIVRGVHAGPLDGQPTVFVQDKNSQYSGFYFVEIPNDIYGCSSGSSVCILEFEWTAETAAGESYAQDIIATLDFTGGQTILLNAVDYTLVSTQALSDPTYVPYVTSVATSTDKTTVATTLYFDTELNRKEYLIIEHGDGTKEYFLIQGFNGQGIEPFLQVSFNDAGDQLIAEYSSPGKDEPGTAPHSVAVYDLQNKKWSLISRNVD